MKDDSDLPSDSAEEKRYFVGIAENVGHHMNFKILQDLNNKVINRYNVRPSYEPLQHNIRLDPLNIPSIVKFRAETADDDTASTAPSTSHDDDDCQSTSKSMPIINPSDLVGEKFTHSKG